MKNKTLFFFLIIINFLANAVQVNAEEFVFESEYLVIKNNGNTIEARDGVKITYKNDIVITAKKSLYNKLDSELQLSGDVRLYDKVKEIRIVSEEIIYKKDIERIVTKGKSSIYMKDNFVIDSENLSYLRKEGVIQSKFKTTLTDKLENQISAKNFKYSVNKRLFKGNDIVMVDKDQNNFFFEKSMIDLNKNEILAKDIKINFSKNIFGNKKNDPRLRGSSLISNDKETVVKNGVFTSCKIREKCPPWSLRSSEIKHNKVKKTINYKKAWLEVYGQPILYFPKFFHPDPSVKRQSGFLMPGILNSSTIGNYLKIPYFFAHSENKDLTITPRFYDNGNVMIQNELRQVGKSYENILDFSLKKSKNSTKSHFFSNSKVDIELSEFNNSSLELNLEKTSNDTYLKTESIKAKQNFNSSVLNSFINFNAYKDDLDISMNFRVYEDLSKTNKADKYEYIYPNFNIKKTFDPDHFEFGVFNYQVSGFQKKYDTNISEKLLINDLNFSSKSFFTEMGFKNNFEILFKNSNKDGKNSSTYQNELNSEVYSAIILNSDLLLSKETNNFKSEFLPKISLRLSPNGSENLSSLDRRIDSTNIFSNNRLGISDSLEGGQSLTFGADYNLNNIDNSEIFSMSLAQVLRDINDKNLPIKSKMTKRSSNVVGDVSFTPNKYLNFEYDFSLDNDLKTSNYDMAKTTISINNFVTSFEYLEENDEIGSESYLSNETSLKFNSSSKLVFRERKNKKTNLKEFYNLMYQYENDCLVAALEYNKNYYADRDLQPTKELFFSLTIVPLNKFKTPTVSK